LGTADSLCGACGTFLATALLPMSRCKQCAPPPVQQHRLLSHITHATSALPSFAPPTTHARSLVHEWPCTNINKSCSYQIVSSTALLCKLRQRAVYGSVNRQPTTELPSSPLPPLTGRVGTNHQLPCLLNKGLCTIAQCKSMSPNPLLGTAMGCAL